MVSCIGLTSGGVRWAGGMVEMPARVHTGVVLMCGGLRLKFSDVRIYRGGGKKGEENVGWIGGAP